MNHINSSLKRVKEKITNWHKVSESNYWDILNTFYYTTYRNDNNKTHLFTSYGDAKTDEPS